MTNQCPDIIVDHLKIVEEKIEGIAEMIRLMPELKSTLAAVSAAQTIIAHSAESMAKTFDKFEQRMEIQDQRYDELVGKLGGTNQIPLKSHYWTIAACLIPTAILGFAVMTTLLYITKQDLKASLHNLEVTQQREHSNGR